MKSETKIEEDDKKIEKENFIAHNLGVQFDYECSTQHLKALMKNEEMEKAK